MEGLQRSQQPGGGPDLRRRGKGRGNGDWGVYNWFQADNDADSYEIQIHFQYKLPESQFDRAYDAIQVNVKEGMTETIQTLKELKLITDADLVTNRERYPWQYAKGGWDQYEQFYGQFHMSPEEYYDRYGEYPAGWFGTESDDSSTETETAPAVDDSHSPSMSAGAERRSRHHRRGGRSHGDGDNRGLT